MTSPRNGSGRTTLPSKGILAACIVLLELVSVIGAIPWACACVMACVISAIMTMAARKDRYNALTAALLAPCLEYLVGTLQGFWVPFVILGLVFCALIAKEKWLPLWAIAGGAVVYVLRCLGIAAANAIFTDYTFWRAMWGALRNGWLQAVLYCAIPFLWSLVTLRRQKK